MFRLKHESKELASEFGVNTKVSTCNSASVCFHEFQKTELSSALKMNGEGSDSS